jgi:hypothetical protein
VAAAVDITLIGVLVVQPVALVEEVEAVKKAVVQRVLPILARVEAVAPSLAIMELPRARAIVRLEDLE